ncbi:MAG: efflux RND transporter permease subunit, partial [Pseudomonadota bacterium]
AMSFQLFPAAGIDQFVVRVTAPPGTSVERMREHMLAVDRELRARIDPQHLEATVIASGEISLDEGDPLTQRGGRFGQIRAVYSPAAARPDHDALDDMRRAVHDLPPLFVGLDLAFNEVKPGPRVGRALEAELTGANNGKVEAAAQRLLDLLKGVPGVLAVDSGLKPGDDELHVIMDRALATYVGVDLATAARHVRAAVGGLVVGTTRRGTEEIDITIRYPSLGNDQVKALRALLVPNQRGGLVPLARIARFEERPGVTTIRHRAGVRVVHVVADVDASVITSVALNRLVQTRESEWLGDDQRFLRVNYGGEEEKNVESFRDLMVAMLFALLGIFFILAIQFNRLGYPILVMLAIPFGIVGIIFTFFLHDFFWKPMPLSFFSTLGMVALSGVVVNSSLLLLEFVKRARAEGLALHEAILSAGRRRLRAIVITATTTVVGLLPTGYGLGGLDPFVAPMALALGWGLAFA